MEDGIAMYGGTGFATPWPVRAVAASSLPRDLTCQKNLRGETSWDTRRKQFFIVTFAGMQTTQRPEMAQMQAREDPSVAKIGIGKHLREQLINQSI
jgi:hypothetical protein